MSNHSIAGVNLNHASLVAQVATVDIEVRPEMFKLVRSGDMVAAVLQLYTNQGPNRMIKIIDQRESTVKILMAYEKITKATGTEISPEQANTIREETFKRLPKRFRNPARVGEAFTHEGTRPVILLKDIEKEAPPTHLVTATWLTTDQYSDWLSKESEQSRMYKTGKKVNEKYHFLIVSVTSERSPITLINRISDPDTNLRTEKTKHLTSAVKEWEEVWQLVGVPNSNHVLQDQESAEENETEQAGQTNQQAQPSIPQPSDSKTALADSFTCGNCNSEVKIPEGKKSFVCVTCGAKYKTAQVLAAMTPAN